MRRPRVSFARYLVLSVFLAPTLFAQDRIRLAGLDRIYFKHTGDQADRLPLPPYVETSLPAEIKGVDVSSRKVSGKVKDRELEYDAEIQDFHLPLHDSNDLWLRQIVLNRQSARITSSWWALYDRGHRSDVWFFRADPDENEHKMLPNYEIVDISAHDDGFDLRIYGSMFRPQGVYAVNGKTFHFTRHDRVLDFSGVLNNFGFFRSYDTTKVSMTMERNAGNRIELLDYANVPEQTLRGCNFQDPTDSDFDWNKMEGTATCVTQKEKKKSSYRDPHQPSFIERNWKER